MMQRMTGLLIGAVFGAVFVFVNAHEPLNSGAGVVLRVLAALALVAVVLLWFRAARPGSAQRAGSSQRAGSEGAPPAAFFGVAYRWVVLGEIVLLFGGLWVMRALGVPEQVNVAWIAFVVGVHFVALAPVWRESSILLPGVTLTVLGVAGFIMAAVSATAWIPFVSGVLSGVVLLGGSLAFALRGAQRA
ncbi:MAG: hypothetical protein HOY71_35055 [Nonomuraea sp.]|nr:hypothetical protein [Nonomuraea sp.]